VDDIEKRIIIFSKLTLEKYMGLCVLSSNAYTLRNITLGDEHSVFLL